MKSTILKYTTLLLILAGNSYSQSGCTDMQAVNYDPVAVFNDGSCIYPSTTLNLTLMTSLSTPMLVECSGLLNYNGGLWVQMDNTDLNLYSIDSLTNTVYDSVKISSTVNHDWEDLAMSDSFIFVGDFGNNFGNRINLHVLQIAKSEFDTASSVLPEFINFSYPDQTSFTSALNNNSFDFEAIFFYHDSLHLFTKDWVNEITKHYTIPAVAGTHTVTLIDSFNVGGLISAASIQNDSLIVLLGYDLGGTSPCFLWMLYDYQPSQFFSGNKRRFSLGNMLTLGLVEGIDFAGPAYGYITNEDFTFVPPQLKSFNLNPYLTSPVSSIENNHHEVLEVFPNPASDFILCKEFSNKKIILFDAGGKTFHTSCNTDGLINIEALSPGSYTGIVDESKPGKVLRFVKK